MNIPEQPFFANSVLNVKSANPELNVEADLTQPSGVSISQLLYEQTEKEKYDQDTTQ
jgi:hypothetical protein